VQVRLAASAHAWHLGGCHAVQQALTRCVPALCPRAGGAVGVPRNVGCAGAPLACPSCMCVRARLHALCAPPLPPPPEHCALSCAARDGYGAALRGGGVRRV
jgi:hypothetical protein